MFSGLVIFCTAAETLQETVALIRKVFPDLEGIEDERISFKATFGDGTPQWSKLMDEVWPTFVDTPPTRMAVVVADGPGEKEKSELPSALNHASVVSDEYHRKQERYDHLPVRAQRPHRLRRGHRRRHTCG